MQTDSSLDPILTTLETVRDYIRYCASQFSEHELFFGHGTDSAWDEAVALVLHSIHLPWDTDPAVLDARLCWHERQAVLALCQTRVQQRMPLPYLLKQAWFAGLAFYVDENVLIPRSPIAQLIEQSFTQVLDEQAITSILELGTGSGCIAIACAHYMPDVTVSACDVCERALNIARANGHSHGCQVNWLHSNWFEQVTGRYDLILANPPYVGQDEWQACPAEYHHEPKSALVADDAGMRDIAHILANAAEFLQDKGVIIFEVGNSQSIFEQYFLGLPVTWLEFERGGTGVGMLNFEQLCAYDFTQISVPVK